MFSVSDGQDDTIEIEIKADADYRDSDFAFQAAARADRPEQGRNPQLTHKPTGITVVCQVERSQGVKPRARGLCCVCSSTNSEIRKRNEATAVTEVGKKKIEWGSQIRATTCRILQTCQTDPQ